MILGNPINKYKKLPIPAKASLWYVICNILQKGVAFFVIPIYVRILTTAEYGKYSTFLSWKDILIIFATLNLYYGVFTKAMIDYDDDRARYTSCMQGLCTLLTSVLLIFYLSFWDFWNRILEMDSITICLLFAYFIFYPAYIFWSVKQRVTYEYKRLIVLSIFVTIITPAFSIAMLVYTDLREKALIWGFLLTYCVLGGVFYIVQMIEGRKLYVKEYWIHALKFNIPLISYYLSLIVLGQSDRIMIKNISGSDKAGIYTLAYQLSMVMVIFTDAVSSSLTPWTYEKLKAKQFSSLNNIPSNLCMILSTAIMGIDLIAPELIKVIGTDEYSSAIWVIPPVTFSVFIMFCYGLYGNIEFYYDSTSYAMIASVIGAIINIILNALLIPKYGFIAAGYTTAFSYGVIFTLHYIFTKKIRRRELNNAVIYNDKSIIGMSFILCAFSGICIMLYKMSFFIRYIIIFLLMIILFCNRNEIKRLLDYKNKSE
ncbi:MAG: oligosaccharide flippase family protein [Ruminococcus sp.]|nr:oligosaccharide flippase family protein [Ruminococcus sp.]